MRRSRSPVYFVLFAQAFLTCASFIERPVFAQVDSVKELDNPFETPSRDPAESVTATQGPSSDQEENPFAPPPKRELRVRDKVFVKPGAEATIGERAININRIPIPATVGAMDGDRVWVERAWVRRSEVMSVDEALEFYSEQIRQDPSRVSAWRCRSAVWCEKNDVASANRDISEAIQRAPEDALNYVQRGIVRGRRYRRDMAIEDYTQAIQIDPKLSVAYTRRAIEWYSQDEHDKVIEDCTEAIRLDAEDPTAYFYRGLSYRKKKKCDEAISDFTDAIRQNPNDSRFYCMRGDVWESKLDYDRALSDYSETIKLDPKIAFAFSKRGILQYKRGALDSAIIDFTEAIQLDPRNVLGYSSRALAWENQGEIDCAIEDVTEAINLEPANGIFRLKRGTLWHKQGELERALDDYTAGIDAEPGLVFYYLLRADVFKRLHRFDDVIADCTQAIKLSPRDPGIYDFRGAAWMNLGKNESAIEDFNKAIQLDPRRARSYCLRGRAMQMKGEFGEALGDYSRAVTLNAKDPICRNFVAWQMATCPEERFRDGNKAVEYATKACELSKWESAEILDTLAAACAENRDFASAVKWQTKAIELFPPAKQAASTARLKLYSADMPYREKSVPGGFELVKLTSYPDVLSVSGNRRAPATLSVRFHFNPSPKRSSSKNSPPAIDDGRQD